MEDYIKVSASPVSLFDVIFAGEEFRGFGDVFLGDVGLRAWLYFSLLAIYVVLCSSTLWLCCLGSRNSGIYRL